MKFKDRVIRGWDAFSSRDPVLPFDRYGSGSSNPGHKTYRKYTSSSFAAAIFNRIALDTSMTTILHVKIDEKEDRTPIQSKLSNCLSLEANIDQTSIQFMQDIVYSMFDEGVVAVVPVVTTKNPDITESYEIEQMRVGRIVQWYPQYVTVRLYNERTGNPEDITVPKASTAIIENPLYAVINGPNATLKRLLSKMAILDENDEQISSGKLDMFIQLPYAVRTDIQRAAAEKRIADLEMQLSKNKRGIAYSDATEKITQLTRPINNNMFEEVDRLNTQFYNQLGLTENVLNGTASESEMRTYYTRTIDPIIENIILEFKRKFLTKTARTQGQTLEAYRDPFKLVPISQIIELGDTFRRNSIATGNEVRKLVGMKASSDPRADELYNPNIADTNQQAPQSTGSLTPPDESSSPNQNE